MVGDGYATAVQMLVSAMTSSPAFSQEEADGEEGVDYFLSR